MVNKGRPPMPVVERFMLRVSKQENGCWLWNGYLNNSGYGIFEFSNRKAIGAHRASYKLLKGEVSDNEHVCHTCDTRSCVNPDHLFLGDAFKNMRDMSVKGRAANQKITKVDADIIIEARQKGFSVKAIASYYKADHKTIYGVLSSLRAYQRPPSA